MLVLASIVLSVGDVGKTVLEEAILVVGVTDAVNATALLVEVNFSAIENVVFIVALEIVLAAAVILLTLLVGLLLLAIPWRRQHF